MFVIEHVDVLVGMVAQQRTFNDIPQPEKFLYVEPDRGVPLVRIAQKLRYRNAAECYRVETSGNHG